MIIFIQTCNTIKHAVIAAQNVHVKTRTTPSEWQHAYADMPSHINEIAYAAAMKCIMIYRDGFVTISTGCKPSDPVIGIFGY